MKKNRKSTSSSKSDNASETIVALESGFEDKLVAFGQQNKGLLIAILIAICLGIIGMQAYRMLQENRRASMQAAYNQARIADNLLDFANDYMSRPLGAVAMLDIADQAYKNNEYELAAKYYHDALDGLEASPLMYTRAQIGIAACYASLGKQEQAIADLTKVTKVADVDSNVFTNEARYHLATLLLAAEDTEGAKVQLDKIVNSDDGGVWAQKANLLRSISPQLSAAST